MKIYRQFMRLGRGDANTSTLLFNQFCVQGGQRWYQRKTRHEFKPNVGLRNTMKMLRNENKTVNNLDNVEDDDDYDFDDEVFHANKTYDQHMA